MAFELRRAVDRAVTNTDWLRSAHSFAFGAHYDPANLSFGPLLAHNSDELRPGPGYPLHRHAGIEILTWVLAGTLVHTDVAGDRVVPAGSLQYLAAGTGIEHTERSGSASEPVRVLQMWLASSAAGAPDCRTVPVDGWGLVGSGRRSAPIALRQPTAELRLGWLPAGAEVELPAADRLHLFVVTGAVEGGGHRLAAEDALRVRDEPAVRLRVIADTELAAWTFAG